MQSAMTRPNRIREWRKHRGLAQSELAALVGTEQMTISHLERGTRGLTVEWMMRLSKALECLPEDLLAPIALAHFEDEAAPYVTGKTEVDAALERDNKFLYVTNSRALEGLGYGPNDPILFDQSKEACEDLRSGDIVIVQLMDRDGAMGARTIVRQFIAPDLLTTNRPGRNMSFHMEEESFTAQVRGVHRLTHARKNLS